MAIDQGYATLNNLKAAMSIGYGDADDDVALELAVEAASRQIDDYCGRRFWQDGTVVARKYFPRLKDCLYVDDISTTTGLVVKVDTTDDGTFDTTLTINTDFSVHPANAAAEFPVRPYTEIRLLDGDISSWTALGSGRPYVEVTAKFGWPTVPDSVERAAIFQAKNIYKAPDLHWGSFQLAEEGSPLRVPQMDPLARALLEGFIRHLEVHNGV